MGLEMKNTQKETEKLDYKAIGERIRKYRKALGLSQEELAERVDISTTHISHIETGSTKLSLQVLVNISNALSVQTDQLLFDSAITDSVQLESSLIEKIGSCSTGELLVLTDIVHATIKSLRAHHINK